MPIQQVAQGGTLTLTAEYLDGGGNLIDPADPLVDIVDQDGTVIVTDDTPDHDSLGHYSYTYTVPVDGVLGRWEAHFTGTIDGYLAGADDEFDVVTPGSIITSTYDLLTLDEAKDALNIPLAEDRWDTELAMYVTAVSQRIDDLCGPGVKRSVTAEEHPGGQVYVWPSLPPVASVGTVVEYVAGTGTTLTAESLTVSGDYVLEHAGTVGSALRRRSGWADRPFGGGTVVVSYVAGRFNSTAAVSPKFKQAAAKTLAWLWRGDQGAGTATFGADDGTSLFGLGFALPNVVKEMLAAETLPPVVA